MSTTLKNYRIKDTIIEDLDELFIRGSKGQAVNNILESVCAYLKDHPDKTELSYLIIQGNVTVKVEENAQT